ncbi:MAG: gliding motility-associated C-terminal domain-containing protein [Elusimicrobiota bacterium]
MSPNTTYYLRAAAVWGTTPVYAATVLSTSTLSPLVAGTTVYQSVLNVSVSWVPLRASPPAASSTSAEGYVVQVSSLANFSTLSASSFTPNVALSTLSFSGLTVGVTYYFRVGTLNWDGVADYASTASFTPIDIWTPSAVTDLRANSDVKGNMFLKWTAPDSNNHYFASSSAASGYQIRIATFPIVHGSTAAWWNGAMDVGALPAPSISTAPPTPAFPGTAQNLLVHQLWPGVTYYALLVSSDEAGNISAFSNEASTFVFDPPPLPPLNLSAVQYSSASVFVSWSSVTAFAYDLDYYKIYFDSTPPYNFSHASTAIVSVAATSATITGLNPATYIFKVTVVDRGVPRYPLGVALESVAASSVTVKVQVYMHQPQEPYGVALISGSGIAALRWMPVVRFADLTPFAASSAPAPGELTGYSIYRSTSWVPGAWLGSWTDVADLSTATLAWTDPASVPTAYYYVCSKNSTAMSNRSTVVTTANGSAYIVAPDNMSYFQVLAPAVAPLEGVAKVADSAYLITVSSRTQDVGELNGRVLESIEFDSYMGGLSPEPSFTISSPGVLSLHYDVTSSSLVASAAAAGKPAAPSLSNTSVYWFNGTNWVQLYGTLNTVSQTMTIQTKYFGRYELRTVERTGGFSFNVGGVSNRFITPNGDRRNDNVVFTFDNPNNSNVSAKIFDLRGRVVAGSLPRGPVSNSLIWDGTSAGRAVPGGVYIYQIQAEGQSFSGTLVIIK